MATLVEHVLFCSPACIGWLSKTYNLEVCSLRVCGSPYPFGCGDKDQESQGIHTLPCDVWEIDDNVVSMSFCRHPPRSGSTSLKGMLCKTLLAGDGDSLVAKVSRRLIHASRLGDHIEVVLRRKT